MSQLSPMPLAGKRVLLGISAGIAAYKSAHLARLLKKAGCEVRVVMTEGAQAFITPLTLQALTGEAVRTSLLDPEAEAGMGHIELARWAELILVAPATADVMARLAHGHADDLLTTLCLASDAECIMAPAMNQAMWAHPATQANVATLHRLGWRLLGPDGGEQACGDVGPGRMREPEALLAELAEAPVVRDAEALRVTITAGPTREALDPVRYLSNHSSGKMGYALAEAWARRGAQVRLISGPVSLAAPTNVERVDVTSASEMLSAAEQSAAESDIFIGCAAVADYRADTVAEHKLKKADASDTMTLTLVKNPDIVATIAARSPRPLVVGFAAETRDLERYARDKLTRKGMDMIVANDVSSAGLGFGADDNAALLLWHADDTIERQALPAQAKTDLADAIVDRVLSLYANRAATAHD
ncbi:bifunctional phosphopantothenoylcysteine decarboxylase/phosphopantothenate--cysteine ligase CoaBC [Chromohalobacter salexigens]|uniref:bifunctional phosphopantothenoylcysteine decarboxylase/phosphopantothenate--cysteine ligase CoaBC n=1 Tax=Chromohalobacter TaxID=42054 RepID=UPI0015C4D1DB|nr:MULTISPECIES: bifunctional phosphopantothenoylcysteine decarboxylase/phosphopantothenate--cysteine ligase CoaBC [Chromohalobacter]NQY45291.1 bifunctional phosphopantothenoylcysteine decarboxylase/phosphopantothenate--cysteine ligase CoaBC [Chromohalobacter sp.]NWO56513.1 bifunctional phosphopantothenoylcysteine decarboxylase/phosphopantothenate--cysteine ligase CoaBC [Chromohalobacter salexigens]